MFNVLKQNYDHTHAIEWVMRYHVILILKLKRYILLDNFSKYFEIKRITFYICHKFLRFNKSCVIIKISICDIITWMILK